MFEQMKVAGALAGLMKNQDRVKESAERIKTTLEDMRVTGEAGGGAVRVTVNGKMKVFEVRIEPAAAAGVAADPASKAAVEKLVLDATNDAVEKAQAMARDAIAREAEALGLPPIPGLQHLLGAE